MTGPACVLRVLLLGCCSLCLLNARPAAATAGERRKRKIDAVGWSGSGLLLPYHIGVLSELVQRHGSHRAVYRPGKTLTAGTSGGGIVAMATTSGTSWSELYVAVHRLIYDGVEQLKACRVNNPTYTDWNCALTLLGTGFNGQKALINDVLSNSSTSLEKVNSLATVAMTQIFGNFTEPYPSIPFFPPGDLCSKLDSKAIYISKFFDREDMVDATLASGFYSGILTSPNCSFSWRNMTVRDGVFSDKLPCPVGKNATCLRVSATYSGYANIICDASTDTTLPAPAKVTSDIYPGISGKPLPKNMMGCHWDEAQYNSTTIMESWFEIIDLAKADALAWLKDNGHA